MFRILTHLTIAAFLFVAMAACGGSSDDASTQQASLVPTPSADGTAQITLTPVGNQMQFEQTEFTVQPGQSIELVFENTATSPAMEHNVVILNANGDAVVNRVGQAALSAGPEAAYVPDDEAVLAATDLAKPGETVSVTFTAPNEPGAYTYVCTFPGHYAMMQGTMRVAG